MNLLKLRPCDNCNGKVYPIFYVIRFSLAMIDHQALNEFVGMHQFFGGLASPALVQNFAPRSEHAVIIAMDKEPSLMTEIHICQPCFMAGSLDLPMLRERINERKKGTDDEDHQADRK